MTSAQSTPVAKSSPNAELISNFLKCYLHFNHNYTHIFYGYRDRKTREVYNPYHNVLKEPATASRRWRHGTMTSSGMG
jgi:hypothetical protein